MIQRPSRRQFAPLASIPRTLLVSAAAMLASCGSSHGPTSGAAEPMAKVHTVARDRDVWQQLLTDHAKIHRTLNHRQNGDRGIVEATTESDDPVVAARIIDHARSMQTRMRAGAQVRIWDPVFKDLFANHAQATIDVAPTAKGVKIVESSSDPETIALLRSHAMGVSDFVRNGHDSGARETLRLAPGAPLPPPEVSIGDVPHRFLLSQPNAAQIALLRSQGAARIVNFRKPGEAGEFDEKSAAESCGIEYRNIPYKEPAELTDEVLAAARTQLQEAQSADAVLVLHCRTGNRVGPGLAMFLALDKGMSADDAIAAAKAVGMNDPRYESIVRDAIRREVGGRPLGGGT